MDQNWALQLHTLPDVDRSMLRTFAKEGTWSAFLVVDVATEHCNDSQYQTVQFFPDQRLLFAMRVHAIEPYASDKCAAKSMFEPISEDNAPLDQDHK